MLGAAKHEYWDCWALIWPDGQLFVDTDGTCPADCWKIGLGWPDAAEIEHAKAKGVRCVLVKVRAPAAPNVEFSGTPAALSPEAPLERRVRALVEKETSVNFKQWAKGRAVGQPGTHGYMMVEAAWDAAVQECIRVTMDERVDAEATQTDEDEAYNTALMHAVGAMQKCSNAEVTGGPLAARPVD